MSKIVTVKKNKNTMGHNINGTYKTFYGPLFQEWIDWKY